MTQLIGSNRRTRRICVWSTILGGVMCAASFAQEQPAPPPSENQNPVQGPPRDSTNPGQTPMDQINLQGTQPGQNIVPTSPEEKKNPFIDDAKFAIQLRTFYFYRDKLDDSLSQAWAIGGFAAFKSGYLADFMAIGVVGYTSQPLYAPDDRDGTLLLETDQGGYSIIGQAYAEFKLTDRIFGAVGLKEYNTPYVNKNDVRMTPNTFEGATFYGTAGGKDGAPDWRFGGGYLSRIKERNEDQFIYMSEDAGSDAERGVSLLGANVTYKGLSFGAIDYHCHDVINIFYTEAKYTIMEGDDFSLNVAGQFSDQRSVGDDRLTGEDFSTQQWGLKSDLGVGKWTLTLAYTGTGSGDDIRSPWGGHPGYTSVQVEDFFRAGEQAILFRAAYDLSELVEGLSVYALGVYGFDVDDPNEDRSELDFNAQWTPKGGLLQGTSYRMRYAYVQERGDDDPDLHDFRFIVNFDFPRQ